MEVSKKQFTVIILGTAVSLFAIGLGVGLRKGNKQGQLSMKKKLIGDRSEKTALLAMEPVDKDEVIYRFKSTNHTNDKEKLDFNAMITEINN